MGPHLVDFTRLFGSSPILASRLAELDVRGEESMKKLSAGALVAAWMLFAAPQAGANLILTTGTGGSDSETLTNLTLGSSITFEYMFSNVVWTTGNFIGLNGSVINPLLGAFPIGQFNVFRNSNTAGWVSASIATAIGAGTIHDLAFTANTFGSPNSAVVEIRNVAIDGRVVGVPEPGTLSLLGAGLLCLGLLRLRRRAA
jgi:hypothetical protein